jgi:hypothetical protein
VILYNLTFLCTTCLFKFLCSVGLMMAVWLKLAATKATNTLLCSTVYIYNLLKVKDSLNRPSVAQRVPGSHILWHSAHEGGEVVSLTHRPLNRRLGDSQNQFGWYWTTENVSTLLELKPWTIQPVASHYTDYIIPTPWLANW